MKDVEMALLFESMSEILDNQTNIMKHLGIIKTDPEWGDGCDYVRNLVNELNDIRNRYLNR